MGSGPWCAVSYPFGEMVTLHRRTATGRDALGNDIYTETAATLTNVAVWPVDANGSGGNEITGARETVIIGLAALLPPGTVVSALDRVTVRGELHEVNGEPAVERSFLTGWYPGVLVNLRRVTG